MQNYLDLMQDILDNGRLSGNRTGNPTLKVFGRQLRFNLAEGFPLPTSRKIFTKGMIKENLWLLAGETNSKILEDEGVNIWKAWGLTDNDLDREVTLTLDERIPDVWGDEQEDESLNGDLYEWSKRSDEFHVILDGNEEAQHKYLDDLGIPRTTTYRERGFTLGDLGPIYGAQWRNWKSPNGQTIDQIAEVINLLKTKPFSRRIIVSAWNPADLPDESKTPQENVLDGKMALAACHTFFQFFVDEATIQERIDYVKSLDSDPAISAIMDIVQEQIKVTDVTDVQNETVHAILDGFTALGVIPRLRLSCQLYMRSVDVPIGASFNIPSYALLTHMFAHVVNMIPGDFVLSTGDSHIYSDQIECVKEQLKRSPRPLPKLKILRKVDSIFDFKYEDFAIEGYEPHDAIKYPSAAV